uniref:SKI family transcriptional corepressor 1 n=1 Tax=Chelonoidis abingdonii TaxID=106734 RepID=A0A8C0GHL0_CHEAB
HASFCSLGELGALGAGQIVFGGMEAIASQMGTGRDSSSSPNSKQELQPYSGANPLKPNQVGETSLYGVPIVSLVIDGQERLCLAQISNTLLKNYSYNEIHNRRVALGITCVQCTPVQLEILRRAGAMPISSRRCGMITKREAERLCKSFLGEHKPPKLPENFAFDVVHECAWGSRGSFIPARYNSSRAKCIKCCYCSMYFSPNKFIFHSHRTPDSKYTQPDAANFNSWRRHLKLSDKTATDELSHAWEDVKAMFNGGTRKRTFSLHGAAAAGASSAAKAALHPPPPGRSELATACHEEPALQRARTGRDRGQRAGRALAGRRGGRAPGRACARCAAPRSSTVPSKAFGMLQRRRPLFRTPTASLRRLRALPQEAGDYAGRSGGASRARGAPCRPGISGAPPTPTRTNPSSRRTSGGAAQDTRVYPPLPPCLPAPPRGGGGSPAASRRGRRRLRPGLGGRQSELEGSEPSGSGRSSATPQEGSGADGERCSSALSRAAAEEERSGDEALLPPLPLPRKGSYLSAFRPVVKDAESIAKLYGTREAYGGAGRGAAGYLSPDFLSEGSSSYRSLSPGADTADEPEVDVESNRFPEDEEEVAAAVEEAEELQLLPRAKEPPRRAEKKGGEQGPEEGNLPPEDHLQALKNAASLGPATTYLCNPEANEQDKDDNHSTAEDLESSKSYQDQRNVSHPSPVNTDRGEEGLSIDFMGTQLVEKDIENLARDELQKLLLEQVELRKKLEREFQSLKDNFQDQMKRELAYREEMVQQLQIVRDTLCNELDQERKARYAIQQKLKEAHDALHHFSCKMLTPRHCTGNCSFKPPLLPQ